MTGVVVNTSHKRYNLIRQVSLESQLRQRLAFFFPGGLIGVIGRPFQGFLLSAQGRLQFGGTAP
jgi:hypothetical protein